MTGNTSRDELLMKYLSGTASGKEMVEMEQLAINDPVLKEEIEGADKVIRQIKALDLMKQVDTPSAYLKLKGRMGTYLQKKGWLYYWQRIAAVLLLPLLLLSIYQFIAHEHRQLGVDRSLVYNEIKTSPGLRSSFELPDGTKVWLNGTTKIKYPIAFSGNERKIYLEGEAYFEVAKNKDKPFIVDMGTVWVEAVGTAFNCMAYPEEPEIETTLTEGKVKIAKVAGGKIKGEYMLQPGQIMIYKQNSDQFYLHDGDLAKNLSWRSGKFIFRNDPLEVVCKKLGRWFNADIEIRDEVLKKYSFTGTFRNEGLREIFDMISISSPITYTMTERSINENDEYGKLKVYVKKK